ncbi:chromobox protein homolog 1-like isoform X1 [Rhizophagus irregularis DAOM 181602=DAOM 197198]|nr:chromobox protein homolog 1-like isoform X1 [Rhizophagus irregularis DAOM 181602=DAOM 197198]
MSHLENYYKYYNLSGVSARILKGEEHYNLYKKPLKEKSSERPQVVVWKPNATHQADLAEMPVDPKGFHYFLVVMEVAEDFHDVVSKIDEIWQRNPPDIPTGSPKVSKKTELLSEGTRVRVKLDEPISVLGNKLHGKFHTGDIRWNPNIRVIKKMILSPEQPPTYLLDGLYGRLGVSRCAYTRKELQIVPENEYPPPNSVIRGQPERFVPERILRHRIRKGQDQYLVKWERYPDTEATWEPADWLEEDVPDLIRKFWE